MAAALESRSKQSTQLGRYALFDQIAEGGMATVHLGRLIGPVGFSKIVAIKQMHESAARNPDFVALAQAYGAEGYRVRDAAALTDAIRTALTHPGPTVIEAIASSFEK